MSRTRHNETSAHNIYEQCFTPCGHARTDAPVDAADADAEKLPPTVGDATLARSLSQPCMRLCAALRCANGCELISLTRMRTHARTPSRVDVVSVNALRHINPRRRRRGESLSARRAFKWAPRRRFANVTRILLLSAPVRWCRACRERVCVRVRMCVCAYVRVPPRKVARVRSPR